MMRYDLHRHARQHAEAMLRQRPQIAIHGCVPPIESRLLGEISDLIDLLRTEIAGVGLLQRDDVVLCDQFGDAIQVGAHVARRQHMLPGLRQIVSVGRMADLNVQRQHAQNTVVRRLREHRGYRGSGLDVRIQRGFRHSGCGY